MLPELSVDAVHARLIVSSVAAVIRTFVGTVGGVTSGFGGFAETAGAAPASEASATQALTATRTFILNPPRARERCRHRYYGRAPARDCDRPEDLGR